VSAAAGQEAPFRVEREEAGDGAAGVVIRFGGALTFGHAGAFLRETRRRLDAGPTGPAVALDLSGVERIDTATLALLLQVRDDLVAGGVDVRLEGARGHVKRLIDVYGSTPPAAADAPARPSLLRRALGQPLAVLIQIGQATRALLGQGKDVLEFTGELSLSTTGAARRPRTVNWSDVPRIMERTGADGLPIVFLISLLIGMIMALQSADQLRQFGADILVADLVGLSITRELGPLMTAIIVAGRSGAAFAAELGTMKVSEEIDALRTIGLDPYRYLVFPRAIGLVLALPLLTILADIVGLAGGLAASLMVLDLTPSAYLLETERAVDWIDVFTGVGKSVVFAAAIAFIACQRGMTTSGGAEGVGRSTTSAVVTTLFALVLLDAVFTILFSLFGVFG